MTINHIKTHRCLKTNNRGITLMETLIALGVLVTGLLAVLTLSMASVSLSYSSEQQIVVTNLAREGLEIVREIRDYAKSGQVVDIFDTLDTKFFNDGVNPVVADGCYIVDSSSNFALMTTNLASGVDCAGSNFDISSCTNCQLYQDVASGEYSHLVTINTTIFKRAVKLISLTDTEKKVLSKVVWSERGRTHETLLETHLAEW